MILEELDWRDVLRVRNLAVRGTTLTNIYLNLIGMQGSSRSFENPEDLVETLPPIFIPHGDRSPDSTPRTSHRAVHLSRSRVSVRTIQKCRYRMDNRRQRSSPKARGRDNLPCQMYASRGRWALVVGSVRDRSHCLF
ncbi:hypothetical protein M413DRAFT_285746 [Hebeloma cylindrosporum]|uniref:Uncharacterized protein n=1 Tax=Hebeloma cylindrosporum TaxID=76867 RepID=A0A0C3BYW6_HEBCY|nr:hypothetical protein M413DRAFT_285746 [Hebeloma cylindrosporum h7]